MRSERGGLLFVLLLLGVLAAAGFVSRPLMPIDETRHVGVAWEMWLRGDFLVPLKNGAPYSHKPPLMMWLFHAGWAVFGVNEWWPRLVSPLISVGSLALTVALARRLWPGRSGIGGQAGLILVSCLLWSVFSTMVMFDVILAFCVLVGMLGIVLAADGANRRGFLLLGLGIGLGGLTKGPVVLLHVLPVALLAPWWRPGLKGFRWYAGILLAVLFGAAIALAWAIPAGWAGGEAYRRAIFWGQTADRIAESFAHRHPVWWYLPHLPLMFFPWIVWPGLWRAVNGFVREGLDSGGRFCLAWAVPVVVGFSLVSGKQMHYLIPMFPAFALFAARSLAAGVPRSKGVMLPALGVFSVGAGLLAIGRVGPLPDGMSGPAEVWPAVLLMLVAVIVPVSAGRRADPVPRLALLGVVAIVMAQMAVLADLYPVFDVRPMARAIRQVQDSGRPVAYDGTYHNQYHFAGRLQTPLLEFESGTALQSWLTEHPDGYAVIAASDIGDLGGLRPVAPQRYRGHAVALLDAQSALSFLDASKRREKTRE